LAEKEGSAGSEGFVREVRVVRGEILSTPDVSTESTEGTESDVFFYDFREFLGYLS